MASPQHILVMLERGAVPFCSFENPLFHSRTDPEWIDAAFLAAFLRRMQDIAPTFVLGKSKPPPALAELIAPHAKIVPLALASAYPDAIVVISEMDAIETLPDDTERNLILRVAHPRGLSARIEALIGKFRRLGIHFTAIPQLTEADLAEYEDELELIAKRLARRYRDCETMEINILSDRMMLNRMRNCGAGVDHLALAPDGKLYLCPAFYCEGEGHAVGMFDPEKGFAAEPVRAAELARAPLCSRCDAFHCKRCIFLNARTTQEMNVPSWQQCRMAHAEREAARKLLNSLCDLEPFARMPRIPELNHRDPLERLDRRPRIDATPDPML